MERFVGSLGLVQLSAWIIFTRHLWKDNIVRSTSCKSVLFLGCMAVMVFMSGCAIWDFLESDTPPYEKDLLAVYQGTELGVSNSADVLSRIHNPEYELLSQSTRVVASQGTKQKSIEKTDLENWFNMVAFNEDSLTAGRKYYFRSNELTKRLFIEPWPGMRYDSETVVPAEVLGEPYANENARRIAILKQILKDFRRDIDEVAADNKKLKVSGMMVNQAFESVLLQLEKSPASAARLSDKKKGLEFDHLSYDHGRIGLLVEEDIATVKIRLGSARKTFGKKEQEPNEVD